MTFLTSTPTCPECGNDDIVADYARGEITCRNCGVVVSESIIDHNAEYRIFSQDQEHKKRVGAPDSILRHHKSLSTTLYDKKDHNGRHLTSEARSNFFRYNKWQTRANMKDSIDRNIHYAMAYINKICSQLHLSHSVKESAAYWYTKTVKNCMMRGRSIDVMAAACIYIAIRQQELPYSLIELSNNVNIKKHKIARSYLYISNELNIGKISLNNANMFIPKICSALELKSSTRKKSHDIYSHIHQSTIVIGKNPIGLAGAVIYIASSYNNEPRTQRDISKITGLTEATIRNRYKEIHSYLKEKGSFDF